MRDCGWEGGERERESVPTSPGAGMEASDSAQARQDKTRPESGLRQRDTAVVMGRLEGGLLYVQQTAGWAGPGWLAGWETGSLGSLANRWYSSDMRRRHEQGKGQLP